MFSAFRRRFQEIDLGCGGAEKRGESFDLVSCLDFVDVVEISRVEKLGAVKCGDELGLGANHLCDALGRAAGPTIRKRRAAAETVKVEV